MFVRWQKRARRRAAFGQYRAADTHWAASLVESRRIDGKPRQRHVAYLSGICQSAIDLDTPHQRGHFWVRVVGRLDQLANQITPEQRRKIETQIAAKVTSPTSEDIEQINASLAGYGFPPIGLGPVRFWQTIN